MPKNEVTVLEGYEINEDSLIGEGSFSRVYRGVHPLLRRERAFKLCKDPEYEENFIDEAKLLAEIPNHRNILKPDSFQFKDKPVYMGMKYVCYEEGIRNVDEYITKKGPFDLSSALALALEILSALALVHSSDKIHLDIHPRNILVELGHAYLTDFNLARNLKVMEDKFSRSVSVAGGGGSDYRAPEQRESKRYKEICDRTDVYMFALVLNKMLLGEWCAKRPSDVGMTAIPTKLNDVIDKCFAHSPKDRPAAKEVLKIITEELHTTYFYEAHYRAIDELLAKKLNNDVLSADDIFDLERKMYELYSSAVKINAPHDALPDLSRIEQRMQADISKISKVKDAAVTALAGKTEIDKDKRARLTFMFESYLKSYRAWKEYERLSKVIKEGLESK